MCFDTLDLQAPTAGEQNLTLYFICCNPSCGHRWRD
jgi:DNA-directed RNA polymerase II subunit RPB9